MVDRGRLIAVEGIDGCGKSTQAKLLADHIGAHLTHEPGASALGLALRKVLLDAGAPAVSLRAEALLMAADRAQHVEEVLRPTLDSGRWVVTDRYSASTLAYQGYGRGLPLAELDALVDWAAGGLEPDCTVLIDVPVESALDRRRASRTDRLESLGADFQARVAAGYRELAARGGIRWAVVDGRGSVEDVASAIRSALSERLGDLPWRS